MAKTPQCALGKIIPTKQDAQEVKRNGWVQQGVLVVQVNHLGLDWVQREFVRQIGNKLYGETRIGRLSDGEV